MIQLNITLLLLILLLLTYRTISTLYIEANCIVVIKKQIKTETLKYIALVLASSFTN